VLRGRTEPLRAFEPASDGAASEGYMRAFAQLESGDPGAVGAFAAEVARNSGDQLASFHLKRLLNGSTGTLIVMD
jgi:adenylate cyclase